MPEGKAVATGTHGAFERDRAFRIRTFRTEDGPFIEAILRASPEAAQWSREALSDFLTSNAGAGAHILVAESSGKVTGFLMALQVAEEAEILNVAVIPEQRRSGQATALLGETIKELNPGGVKTLFLEVRESNHAAIAFYRANGFATGGRRPAYYREPEEAAICMMRKVAGVPG